MPDPGCVAVTVCDPNRDQSSETGIVAALCETIKQQRSEISHLHDEVGEQQRMRENLEVALANARKIGAAVGIVMRDQLIDYEQAFTLLSRASQTANRKLRELADDVLVEGHLDAAPRPNAARL